MSGQALTARHRALQPEEPAFDALVDMIAPADGAASPSAGMVAASSARIYRDTYRRWQTWAAENGHHPLDLNYSSVGAYLNDQDASKATKQRQLSALRKLAEVLAVVDFQDPARRAAYESLKMLKVRAGENEADHERQRRALSPADADRMLRVWADDQTPRGKRNRAIVAVLLLSGLRRAELCSLTWQDIDFENGVITVRHGKGDKPRQAAVYSRAALEALREWQRCQPSGYRHVFVNLRKGGHFTGDTAMTPTSIYRVIAETAARAGLGHVKPHDLRRTLATELLTTGDPVHHVQVQLGHTNAQTTLDNYAVAVDARQRRKSGKVRYG